MNRFKILLSSLGIGILAVAIIFFIFNSVNNDTFQLNAENISIFEEDESVYYLKKTSKDHGFKVVTTNNNNELKYKLTDEDGNTVLARLKEKSNGIYEINAPKLGYDEGQKYYLELGSDTSFSHENLAGAKSLVFAIDRDPIEHYKFTDQVIELEETIREVATDTIEVANQNLEEDTIIFGMNDRDEYVAYKIAEVLSDGSAEITYPAIDEIYAELEVYGNYDFDFHDLVANPDIKAELISNIKKSDFFSNLVTEAYAEEEDHGTTGLDVEFQIDSNTNAVQFKAIITLKAGKDGLFGKKSLKHHEVKLTLINELGTEADVDISSIRNWDVAAIRTESFDWSLDINYEPPKIDDSTKLSELFKQDKEEEVKEIVKLLNKMTSDDLTNEIKLFDFQMPVAGVPGLIFSLDIHLALHFELQANLNFHNDYKTTTTAGLMYSKGDFSPYFNNSYETSGGGTSFKGDLNSKLGVNADLKTKLLHDKIAYISLKPEVGLYADAYVALTLHSTKLDKKNTYGYFESGTYFNVETKGHLNTLLKEFDHHHQSDDFKKRFESLSFGDYKVIAGLDTVKSTLYAKDFQATPAEFTFDYYDIREKKDVSLVLNPDKMTYFLDGDEELKLKDGKIIIPKTNKEEITVQAVYKDDSNKTYKQDLTIYISENRTGGLIEHQDFDEPMELTFSSGAGAWRTFLNLNSDGTFSGVYSDSNAGMSGNGYLSTIYISEFEGVFGEIERIDDETYSMKLLELNQKYEIGEEWIDNNVKYIAAETYGLEEGKNFYLYTPHKNKDELSMDVLSWGAYAVNSENKLGQWALHNLKTDYTFYSKFFIHDSEDESEATSTELKEQMLTSFKDIAFQDNYKGPGSEFIGTWNPAPEHALSSVLSWEIFYKDGIFYMTAEHVGDPRRVQLTAEYKDGKLFSENLTIIDYQEYDVIITPDGEEGEFPETVAAGDGKIEFYFKDGYLQSNFEETSEHFYGYDKE